MVAGVQSELNSNYECSEFKLGRRNSADGDVGEQETEDAA
jgi:hypothetical protein